MPSANGHTLTIGDITVVGASDGRVAFDPRMLFPKTPLSVWEKYHDRFPEYFKGDSFFNNLGSFLIRSGEESVLCDTGFGPHGNMLGSPAPGLLLDDLKAKGASLEEVDSVFLTHLHGDHVGWNLGEDEEAAVGWKPTFPNARYMVHEADWAWFTQPEQLEASRRASAERTYLPLEDLGVLHLMDGETELAPGVTAFPTPGHTPGHMSVLIASNNERAMIIGDIAGSPMQLTETDWFYLPDWDQAMGRDARYRILDMAEQDDMVVMGSHLSPPGWGVIVRWEGKRYWQGL
ncbi:MAG: MBL fold metallo-hydrolase [Dehalococcoidia bacterium]